MIHRRIVKNRYHLLCFQKLKYHAKDREQTSLYPIGAIFSDIEGLEIASGTSRYRKIVLGVKYGRTNDDWVQKCHGEFFSFSFECSDITKRKLKIFLKQLN